MNPCHQKQDDCVERISNLTSAPVKDSKDDQFESQFNDGD